MKDKGISRGFVQDFDTSNRRSRGAFYGLRKMFWTYLNKLNVPFYDPCCPEASTLGQGMFSSLPQNNILAGAGGAIPIDNYLTTINTDAGGDAFTLADGTQRGQVKRVNLVVDGGGDAVITYTGGTATLGDATDYVLMVWNGTAWSVIENSGAAVT